MSKTLAFIGRPLNFKNKFYVYPATIGDILSEESFNTYRSIFTITAEDIRDKMAKEGNSEKFPSPFEFLLINCYHDNNFYNLSKKAFEFFTHQTFMILFEERIIIVGDMEQTILEHNNLNSFVTLEEKDYFDFQNLIRESLGEKPLKAPEPIDPDEDPRVAQIKAKARERDRIKARQNNKNGISLETIITAICCMGIGITPLNIGEMSYAAIGPIMNMMQEKEKYDIDIRSLLAGADSKKVKPKYWIRNNEKD